MYALIASMQGASTVSCVALKKQWKEMYQDTIMLQSAGEPQTSHNRIDSESFQ
jgi:hypothetical protein